MKTAVIIQARIGSTRLPRKVLKVLHGKSILAHVIDRCKRMEGIDEIVVATTQLPQDDAVEAEAQKSGVVAFRGSETNVLERYYHAATECKADYIVRITADCPLLDSKLSSKVVSAIHHMADLDYCHLVGFPIGMDTEVFTYDALETAYRNAITSAEKEHVTPYINLRPDQFRLYHVTSESDISKHRWTLDTPEDWRFITEIYDRLYPQRPDFGFEEVMQVLSLEPELSKINAHVKHIFIKHPGE